MPNVPKLLICSFEAIPSATSMSRRLTEYLRAMPDNLSIDMLVPRLHHEPLQSHLGPARLFRVPTGRGAVESRGEAFDRAVRRFVETQDYTLIHFTHSWGGLAVSELKSELGFHTIFDAQNLNTETSDADSQKRIQRQQLFCLMKADTVITGSTVASKHLHALGVPKSKISVLAPPIPFDDYEAYSNTKMATPGLRLCCLSWEVAPKALSQVLRAMSLLPRGLLVELVICSSFPGDTQLVIEKEIERLRLGHRVSLQCVNSHEDLPSTLSQMDVGIVSMDSGQSAFPTPEPLSMAGEFFAAACPILVPDVAFFREAFPREFTFPYTLDDAPGLAELLTKLAQSPNLRLSAAPLAKTFTQKHLDRRVIQKQLFRVYETLTQSSWNTESTSNQSPLIEKADVLHTQHSGVIGPLEDDGDDKDALPKDLWFSQLALGYCPPPSSFP